MSSFHSSFLKPVCNFIKWPAQKHLLSEDASGQGVQEPDDAPHQAVVEEENKRATSSQSPSRATFQVKLPLAKVILS